MLIKRPLADGEVEVTFRMALQGVSRLSLLGDFNHWNAAANPLRQSSRGVWSTTLRLPAGEYRYRYVANENEWLNDPEADAYAANEFGSENSVLRVEAAAAAKVSAATPQQKRAMKAKAEREAIAAPKKRASRKKPATSS